MGHTVFRLQKLGLTKREMKILPIFAKTLRNACQNLSKNMFVMLQIQIG